MSLILSAPSSGAGKTTLTLGILRALSRRGFAVRGAKSGPDYIDPRFHAAACGRDCVNLDAWAMAPDRLRALAAGDPLLIEGAMGLFDGAADGRGATADLARLFGIPVILVVDAARMAQSVAPLVAGFARFDPDVRIAGVILNRVGSLKHDTMLRKALAALEIPVIGSIMRDSRLAMPSRHLGLVQAEEHPDLNAFLDQAADLIESSLDLDAFAAQMSPMPAHASTRHPPPAQRIAIAKDAAFAFSYPHMMQDWRDAGADISVFSPLSDDPVPDADLICLPGGYPELYAGRLAANTRFLMSLKNAAKHIDIYGECGGYMVLGDSLTDADGVVHKMAGLLRLQTSFARRNLHLGYRHLTATATRFKGDWRGHEFHYATTVQADGDPLFTARDARGAVVPPMGLVSGHVAGSFAHLIDRAP